MEQLSVIWMCRVKVGAVAPGWVTYADLGSTL